MSDVPASEICSTDKSTRWKEKTLKMSLLLLFVINSFLLVVIVAFIWSRRNNVCITEQCVITANRVITAMDRSIDPCADFYRFACGNWIKNNPVPYWTSSWDRMAALKESLAQDMLQLLDSEEQLGQKGLSGPTAVKKAKTFYRTCIGETEMTVYISISMFYVLCNGIRPRRRRKKSDRGRENAPIARRRGRRRIRSFKSRCGD